MAVLLAAIPFRKSVSILRLVAANRPLSPLFRRSILVYSPGFTLLMGSYFAGTITENTSHNRFNINNLETAPGSHLALFVFQLSETLLGIGVQERH